MKHEIIYKPSITEKALALSKLNWYTFQVALTTRKNDFKKVIEEKTKSKTIGIRSKIVRCVSKRRGKSTMTKLKYMIVKLPKDKKIEGFETAK